MNPRHQLILTLVHQARKMSVSELSQRTGVSEVTVRNDLTALEKQGLLKRVHGSAMALESDDPDARMNINYLLKERLAERAAQLVEDGETVFIEGAAPTPCWPAIWPCTSGSPSSPSAATSPTCCATPRPRWCCSAACSSIRARAWWGR